jgi:hypothetical protein
MVFAYIMTGTACVHELVCSASPRCAQQTFLPRHFPNPPIRPLAGPPDELTHSTRHNLVLTFGQSQIMWGD